MGCVSSAVLGDDSPMQPSEQPDSKIAPPANDDVRCDEVCRLVKHPDRPDPRFDAITQLVKQLLDVSFCMVTLLEGHYTHPLAGGDPTGPKLLREDTFCAWSLLTLKPEVLIVPDATLDLRFKNLPAVVGPAHLRFYAGAPLISSGDTRLGSLCVIDKRPRHDMDGAAAVLLANFAEIVVREIENFAKVAGRGARSVCLVDTAEDWQIKYATDRWKNSVGDDVGQPFWTVFDEQSSSGMQAAVKRKRPSTLYTTRVATNTHVALELKPTTMMDVLPDMPVSCIAAAAGPGGALLTRRLESLYFAVVSDPKSFFTASPRLEWPIDNLQVGEILGRGAFGSVFRGRCGDVPVAVKVVIKEEGSDDTEECAVGKMCDHFNLVRTLEAVSTTNDGATEACIVMELCEGENLQGAIDEGRLVHDVQKMIDIVFDVANGLTYLHSKRVVHLDLSANNVLLLSHGSAKVTDFGLAHSLNANEENTIKAGTITHMPPELLGKGILTTAVDVYSLGVIMWQLVTAQRPWAGLRAHQILRKKTRERSTLTFPQHTPFQDGRMNAFVQLAEACMNVDYRLRPDVAEVCKRLETM